MKFVDVDILDSETVVILARHYGQIIRIGENYHIASGRMTPILWPTGQGLYLSDQETGTTSRSSQDAGTADISTAAWNQKSLRSTTIFTGASTAAHGC